MQVSGLEKMAYGFDTSSEIERDLENSPGSGLQNVGEKDQKLGW